MYKITYDRNTKVNYIQIISYVLVLHSCVIRILTKIFDKDIELRWYEPAVHHFVERKVYQCADSDIISTAYIWFNVLVLTDGLQEIL